MSMEQLAALPPPSRESWDLRHVRAVEVVGSGANVTTWLWSWASC